MKTKIFGDSTTWSNFARDEQVILKFFFCCTLSLFIEMTLSIHSFEFTFSLRITSCWSYNVAQFFQRQFIAKLIRSSSFQIQPMQNYLFLSAQCDAFNWIIHSVLCNQRYSYCCSKFALQTQECNAVGCRWSVQLYTAQFKRWINKANFFYKLKECMWHWHIKQRQQFHLQQERCINTIEIMGDCIEL